LASGRLVPDRLDGAQLLLGGVQIGLGRR